MKIVDPLKVVSCPDRFFLCFGWGKRPTQNTGKVVWARDYTRGCMPVIQLIIRGYHHVYRASSIEQV